MHQSLEQLRDHARAMLLENACPEALIEFGVECYIAKYIQGYVESISAFMANTQCSFERTAQILEVPEELWEKYRRLVETAKNMPGDEAALENSIWKVLDSFSDDDQEKTFREGQVAEEYDTESLNPRPNPYVSRAPAAVNEKDDYRAFLEKSLEEPQFREAYEELEPAFNITRAILAVRTETDWSEKELSRRSGVPVRTIRRLERMEISNISVKTLQKIAKAMDKRLVVRFIDGTEE